MFSIKYLEKSRENPNGLIVAQIYDEAGWIYQENEFPFVFEVWLKGKLKWSCNLYPNHWASWDCLENNELDTFIKDIKGNIVSTFKLDVWTNRNSTEQFFNTWVTKNPNSNGIVIGTHDGSNGEWVNLIKDNKINAVLVEGSQKQFNQLTSNYEGFTNVKFRNDIITSDGRECEFYEFGEGYANTIDKEHYEKHVSTKDLSKIILTKTTGINDLILQENLQNTLDWIHLDTEAIDDEIIMGLDFSIIKKPKLIIFETINFSEERTGDSTRINKLFEWLESNGFRVKYDYWNSFAYLT